jgi:hypothetical protein
VLKIPAKLASLQNINGYSAEADADKLAFHREGTTFLRALAKEVGMPEGTYSVRTNKAGPAVSGEVTLHGETLYVQLSESCVGGRGVGILYRTCRGTSDYSGGQNNWLMLKDIARNPERRDGFVSQLKRLGGFA